MHGRLGRVTRWLLPLLLVPLLTACGSSVITVVGNEFDQQVPAINRTMVAWEDYRNIDAGGGVDVYARDMTSTPGSETLIAGGPGDQGQPTVSDQYIVWVDNGNAIRARPRNGGSVLNVAVGNGDKFDPAVCGSLVVWTVTQNGNTDIYGRDLAGGQAFPIANTPAIEAYPDCDGNRVVYMSTGTTTGADISMFDRTTGATTPVSTQPWHEWRPAISGNRVVWQALASADTGIDLLGVDLSTGTPFTVTTAVGDQTMPDISGTLVVWQDGQGAVWSRDLAGGTPSPVAMGGTGAAQVSGRSVVWQQQQNGSWDILMKNL